MSEVRNDVEELKLLDIKDLQPFQGKLKDLSKANYAKLRKQIETLGFSEPIAVWRDKDKNYILNGHQRLRTLQVMAGEGVTVPKIPAVFVRAKDKKEEKRKVLALTSQYGEMTGDGLVEFMTEAGIEWPDIKDNFRFPEIDFKRFESEFFTDPIVEDEVPEPPKVAITKPGDLWELGEHRLLCGDCTKPEDVEKTLAGGDPFIMVTDPPYGVDLDQSWRDDALGGKQLAPGNKDKVSGDDRADWRECWALFGGDVAYVWHAGKYSDVVMGSLRASSFEPVQQLIWNKSVMVMGRSDYHFKHEPCWYAVRNGRTHGWIGDRQQTTVIDAESPKHIMSGSKEEKCDHPTQKPVKCMSYLIQNHAGDVYEPFCGSGTTLIAAEQLNRKCYAIEIEPKYCDVIIERWTNLTGGKAKRVSGQLGNVKRAEASRKRLESKGIHV